MWPTLVNTPPAAERPSSPLALGPVQRAQVAGALSHFLPKWSVELTGGDGEAQSIVILPEDGEDETGPALVVSHNDGRYYIDAFQWDRYWTIGEYNEWPAVLREVRMTVAWEIAHLQSAH